MVTPTERTYEVTIVVRRLPRVGGRQVGGKQDGRGRDVREPAPLVPDTIEPIRAWRAWKLRQQHRIEQPFIPARDLRPGAVAYRDVDLDLAAPWVLLSPQTNIQWQEPRVEAECDDFLRFEAPQEEHQAPQDDCSCGIHGVYALEHLRHHVVLTPSPDYVAVGEVDLYGKVVVGQDGARAQRARIRSLYLFEEQVSDEIRLPLLRALKSRYDVDVAVVPGRELGLSATEPRGKEPPPEPIRPKRFGTWDPSPAERVPTPVGDPCAGCGQPIKEGDHGWLDAWIPPRHVPASFEQLSERVRESGSYEDVNKILDEAAKGFPWHQECRSKEKWSENNELVIAGLMAVAVLISSMALGAPPGVALWLAGIALLAFFRRFWDLAVWFGVVVVTVALLVLARAEILPRWAAVAGGVGFFMLIELVRWQMDKRKYPMRSLRSPGL